MTKPIARDPMYRKRVFDADIIELCVRWYITYRLSYRDLVEMMAERGVKVAHSTILRWVTRYVPEFEKRWSRFSKAVGPRIVQNKSRLSSGCGPMVIAEHSAEALAALNGMMG